MACGCPERRPGAARVERHSQDWTRRRRATRHPGGGYTAQERGPGAARPERGGLVRRGKRAAATGARRPGAARPERCGPGRRPERGGPARRPGAVPAALAAGLLAARWHGPGCPWPLAIGGGQAWVGGGSGGNQGGERSRERDERWGMNRFRVWGGLREHLTRSWAFGGPRKRGWR